MKYVLMDSITLYEVLDFMDTLDIHEYTQERYDAVLVSESIKHEMLKLPYNCHPTNFTTKDIDGVDEVIYQYMLTRWKLHDLNGTVMVQSLYRPSEEIFYYFPTLNGIRRGIKVYLTFNDKESLNRIKLTNYELYSNLELVTELSHG